MRKNRDNIFDHVQYIHLIGIGGVGVSALAHKFLWEGKQVSGSDMNVNPLTTLLQTQGAQVFYGHHGRNVKRNVDVIIYSHAISDKNPELKKARRKGIPVLSYPEALGVISREYETIAVSGTHGKTTTTAMVADILEKGGKDPTVIVGSLRGRGQVNFRAGKGRYLVVEACEYRESFLNLSPKILIITNIDDDHLDYFKNQKRVVSAFARLVRRVPKEGYIICDLSAPHIKEATKDAVANIIHYPEYGGKMKLRVIGRHNYDNARAAYAVGVVVGVPGTTIQKALRDFRGTWRRMEYKGKTSVGALVYDDYAHHPTEVHASLLALREKYPRRRLIVCFQPHLYSRTKHHLSGFGKSLSLADIVVVAPVYAAREKEDKTMSGRDVARVARTFGVRARYFSRMSDLQSFLKKMMNQDDVIVTMGAGDIYKLAEKIV